MATYNIGSLNVRKGKPEESDSRKFNEFICQLTYREQLTALALQEVGNENEVTNLLKAINNGGLYKWSGFYKKYNPECGLAFLWNKNLLEECSDNKVPTVWNTGFRMKRDPLYGRFYRAGSSGPDFEIRLLNIHLFHGNDNGKQRQEECKLVASEIYNELDTPMGKFIPFILGDFNFTCTFCNNLSAVAGAPEVRTFLNKQTTIKGSSLDHFSFNCSTYASSQCIRNNIPCTREDMPCSHEFVRNISCIDISSYFEGGKDEYNKWFQCQKPN